MDRFQKALELSNAERERKRFAAAPGQAAVAASTAANLNGVIPILQSRAVATDASVLRANGVLPADAVGPAASAFKMLRTQVLQRLRERNWNTLAVMSATPNDGKTFTAINLAIAIAGDSNHSSLLVDFDLRNPSVHQRFGLTPTIGVEQCLRGEANVTDALVNLVDYPRMSLLPAREAVSHSSELISGARARQIVRALKQRSPSRIVLFDLPPVLGADDALAFAPQVDAALIVVGEEHTRREDLLRCFEILGKIPVIGTVLNGSRTDASLAYAY
jgi:Mrp family chromosome partitioning ATPase